MKYYIYTVDDWMDGTPPELRRVFSSPYSTFRAAQEMASDLGNKTGEYFVADENGVPTVPTFAGVIQALAGLDTKGDIDLITLFIRDLSQEAANAIEAARKLAEDNIYNALAARTALKQGMDSYRDDKLSIEADIKSAKNALRQIGLDADVIEAEIASDVEGDDDYSNEEDDDDGEWLDGIMEEDGDPRLWDSIEQYRAAVKEMQEAQDAMDDECCDDPDSGSDSQGYDSEHTEPGYED